MRWLGLLLLGACGFQIAPGSGSPGGDPSPQPDGGVDAATVVDGRAIDAPEPTWVRIDAFSVPCTGSPVTSSAVLAAGVTYRLHASGQCIANTLNQSRADAEYLGYNLAPPQDVYGGVDNGLAIDDATPGGSKEPRWGNYQSSHVYRVDWIGAGATITARYHEDNLSNNSGSLELAIHALQ